MPKRINVVLSQGQSNNPAKRKLEEDIVTALLMEVGIDVTVIPHLYDLAPDGTGMLALQGVSGNLVVHSWMYERAARWILDRNSIAGHCGVTLLTAEDEEDEDDETEQEQKDRVLDGRQLPNRKIYCIDLRSSKQAAEFVAEIKRIAAEEATQVVDLMNWVGGNAKPEQLERFAQPTNDTALGSQPPAAKPDSGPAELFRIEETGGRRWYPVIDYSRCTNCMECIDFCLFGVYGVDRVETILVEQPDNCRKGCPACSRVCPENAIIFPQHKTPAIAGADVAAGSMKIDLSRLFGAPEGTEDAFEVAARERDEQLVMAGRQAVGMDDLLARRQPSTVADSDKDELDSLIDELDDLNL